MAKLRIVTVGSTRQQRHQVTLTAEEQKQEGEFTRPGPPGPTSPTVVTTTTTNSPSSDSRPTPKTVSMAEVCPNGVPKEDDGVKKQERFVWPWEEHGFRQVCQSPNFLVCVICTNASRLWQLSLSGRDHCLAHNEMCIKSFGCVIYHEAGLNSFT